MPRIDISDLQIRTYPSEIMCFDGSTVRVDALYPSGLNDSIGKLTLQETVIQLPSQLASGFDSFVRETAADDSRNCLSFAFGLIGGTAPSVHERYDREYDPVMRGLRVDPVRDMDTPLLTPGLCVSYREKRPQTHSRWNPPEYRHWAVTCGGGKVVQVAGISGPICFTDISTPMIVFNNPSKQYQEVELVTVRWQGQQPERATYTQDTLF